MRAQRIAIITIGGFYRQWLTVPAIGDFVAGVTTAGRETDVDVLLDEMPELLEPSRLVRRGEIGGAILLVDSTVAHKPIATHVVETLSHEIPVVWGMGAQVGIPTVDHVAPDHLTVGCLAARYLLDAGCKRLVFVTSTPEWSFVRFRAAAFASEIADAGLEPMTCIVSDDPRAGQAYAGRVTVAASFEAAAQQLAEEHSRPDGVFGATDAQLAELYTPLMKAGVRLDHDVRLVGCDNEVPRLSLMCPRPATIDLNTAEIARRALRRLCLRMEHVDEPPVLIQVPPRLVVPPTRHEPGREVHVHD